MLQLAEQTETRQGSGTVVKSPPVPGARLRPYLAFQHGRRSFFAKLIKWWTGSQFSHVEIALWDGAAKWLCWSADEADGGVRCKVQALSAAEWVWIPIDHVRMTDALNWANDRAGRKYDWAGILGMVWRPRNDNPDRYFCSEFCVAALQAGGWPAVQGLVPGRIDPGTLHDIAAAWAKEH